MDTSKLKKFAQYARRYLKEQVSAKMNFVLEDGSAPRRESPNAVNELEKQIRETSKEEVTEKTAYIWFNRFCALRFMDVNRYTRISVISPLEGQFQPEILAQAKMGHIDEEMVTEKIRQPVFNLLSGKAPSRDPQQEAYRMLIVAVCNYYNKIMPFLFEKIEDYTELLMPDDLLSGNSILAYTREAMTPNACRDVEVIGWLYQYYISEKKDEVFEGLKKNKKITPENIPAATQLFTPHWIVRYLVENSLGRLWMLNHPNSSIIKQMDYYIKPEQAETDFLKINKPEEIKICDPACGSGHMLVYAFDLLYAIYEEEGYEASEIPYKILINNLYGIEIDERAGELAGFALTMKAREKYRRFFSKPICPNICVLKNVKIDKDELENYMDAVGRDLFTSDFEKTLSQFEEADNLGSLIRPALQDITYIQQLLEEKDIFGLIFLLNINEKALQILKYVDYLSPKYHVVIANPPYMGGKGMNDRLKEFAQKNYPDSKFDLFAMFIERNLNLSIKQGMIGMITMQSWMFLSSFEKLREKILSRDTILSMAHLGPRAFDSIGGEVVSTTAFIIENTNQFEYKGAYLRLVDGNNETEKEAEFKSKRIEPYRASAADFKKIPGSPIAYWIKKAFYSIWDAKELIENITISDGQNKTGNNEKYLRFFWELPKISFDKTKWITYAKGGQWRKWYGNIELMINWSETARSHYRKDKIARLIPEYLWYKQGITWSFITTKDVGFRLLPKGGTFDVQGSTLFFKDEKQIEEILALLNSKPVNYLLRILNPTISLQVKDVRGIPIPKFSKENVKSLCTSFLNISISDWSSYEESFDFIKTPLIQSCYLQSTLDETYTILRAHWQEMTLEMQKLEEENNRIFIEAYGLQDELTPDVPLSEITLTCNPHYRYGGNKSEEELEALLLADTMKEFISYAVGCMFGRYSQDKAGLILANQGETIEDYLGQVPEPIFPPDLDNVIPILDRDWFMDDITGRFYEFLKITFGKEHYEENLKFIENAIGKDIRKYFLKDFYNDHIKRYKKRPIYWLFSSPKGSFNALIYMHRYRPDTVSVVLNDYLREFCTKLVARKSHMEQVSNSVSASQIEKTKALKEIENLKKIIKELETYEKDVLYPLAAKKLNIDLDDGVKANYGKFGSALKNIPGLYEKEE